MAGTMEICSPPLSAVAEAVEEADVLVADVEVDEAADALLVEEPVADAGVALLEILDDEGDGGAVRLHLVGAAGEGAERGGDADGDFDVAVHGGPLRGRLGSGGRSSGGR